jgi:hypothetical protein
MPSYLTPRWLLVYALGVAAWVAIWLLLGPIVAGALVAASAFGAVALLNWISTGYPLPPEDRRR